MQRGLGALDLIIESKQGLRLTDLAAKLDVDKSNASHLVRTLQTCGYAKQGENRRYYAGEKIADVVKTVQTTLEDVIEIKSALSEKLQSLVHDSHECAHLAILVGNKVWYADKVTSPLPLKVDHPVGTLSPLYCTALGKVYLAFSNKNLADYMLEEKLIAYTPRTLVDKKCLEDEIDATVSRGYAIDDEEFTAGIRCVAVPLFDSNGQVRAAMGLSGPSSRIDQKRLSVLGELLLTYQ